MGYIVNLKLAQLQDYVFVGMDDIPVHKNIIERLKKIHAIGFDISTLDKLQLLAPLMGSEITTQILMQDMTPDIYPAIYDYILGKDPGFGVTERPKGPPLEEEPDVEPEPTEEDVSGLPTTYSIEDIKKLRGATKLALKTVIATSEQDIRDLLVLLKDAGFNVKDKATTIQLLQFLAMSKGPTSTLAQTVMSIIPNLSQEQYDWLVHDIAVQDKAPKKENTPKFAPTLNVPEENKTEPTPPPTTDTPKQEIPTKEPAPMEVLDSGHMVMPKGVKGGASFQHMVNNYDEVIKATPSGINPLQFGEKSPINVMPEDKRMGNELNRDIKGGQNVRVYGATQPFIGMVVGHTGDGRLALRANNGQMVLIDPVKAEARYSTQHYKPNL